jgi:hypothetical protein
LLTYRVRLDVPGELVLFVSRLLARRRKAIGTRKGTRCLGCYRQALFVLAWYRDKTDIPRLGAGFGLSQATSYRYVAEGTKVVSAEAPGLEEALERAVAEGTPYVILDGKIVASDRCHAKTVSRKGREIDLWYSGRRRTSAGTSRACSTRMACRCGSRMCCRGMSMIWPRPGRMSCRCCGITLRRYPAWPTAGTKAQVTASSPR